MKGAKKKEKENKHPATQTGRKKKRASIQQHRQGERKREQAFSNTDREKEKESKHPATQTGRKKKRANIQQHRQGQ